MNRFVLVLCLLAVVALFAANGCQSSPALSVIQVTPSSAALTTTGETVQFKATGTFVHNFVLDSNEQQHASGRYIQLMAKRHEDNLGIAEDAAADRR